MLEDTLGQAVEPLNSSAIHDVQTFQTITQSGVLTAVHISYTNQIPIQRAPRLPGPCYSFEDVALGFSGE